jgi:polygalacturonase
MHCFSFFNPKLAYIMKQQLTYLGKKSMVLILLMFLCTIALAQENDSGNRVGFLDHSNMLLPDNAGSPRQDETSVRDFGAIPGDGIDDSKSILAAIEHARANGIRSVRFEAGVYEFKVLPGWETSERGKRSCYISLQDVSNLELVGAVDAQGNPATRWVKDNDLKECQPMILSIQRGTNVAVRNIVVDMAPYYYSAGRVVAVQGDEVTIDVLPGHPRVDGQKAFIMGLYDLKARKAKVVRLTWDSNLPQWHTVGDEKDRRMTTQYAPLAKACVVNDGVFWFQGNYSGSLLDFGHINGLLVENIRILSGHGFSLTCNYCHDIAYRKVMLMPEGNRIATTCRDGFKIYCASGKVLMDGVHNEGCLGDDGQNIHGTWLPVVKMRSERVLVATGRTSLTPGREAVLLDDRFNPAFRSKVVACVSEGRDMVITFADPIPKWVHEKTPVEPQEWLPDSLHIVNSVYRSTGRFGVYLKASNTLIENCLFENNVAGIHIGGEWSWGAWLESTNSQNVEIRHCTFRDNHLDIRYGGEKMDVAIDIDSWTGVNTSGQVRNILIHDNTFEDESLCVRLQKCSDVWFWNNTIKNCGKDLLIDDKTTDNIRRSAK